MPIMPPRRIMLHKEEQAMKQYTKPQMDLFWLAGEDLLTASGEPLYQNQLDEWDEEIER